MDRGERGLEYAGPLTVADRSGGRNGGPYTFQWGVQEIFLRTACPPSGLIIEWSHGCLTKHRTKCRAEHRSLALLQTNNQAPRRTGQPRPFKVIQGFLNEFRQ